MVGGRERPHRGTECTTAVSVILLVVAAGVGALAMLASASAAPAPSAAGPLVPASAPTYSVTFNSTARLPSGDLWTLQIGPLNVSIPGILGSVQLPNGTYDYLITGPPGYNSSKANGSVTVAGGPVVVGFHWITHLSSINFHEVGLPSRATWFMFIDFNNQNAPAGTDILWRLANGSHNFSVSSNFGWGAHPSGGTFSVNGTSQNWTITFTPPPPRYEVNFTETGLPPGVSWTVAVDGIGNTTTAGLVNSFDYTNGTYDFVLNSSSRFLPHPGAGTFVVNGGPKNVPVTFTAPLQFTVVFRQVGLSTGSWFVFVGGSNHTAAYNSSILVSVNNGTYPYTVGTTAPGWKVSGSTGSVSVNNAALVLPPVTFQPADPKYVVTFVEQGLPSGTWWATLNGTNQSVLAGSGVVFDLTNGSYVWSAGTPLMYNATPSSGVTTVYGAMTTITIVFAAPTNHSTAPTATTSIGTLAKVEKYAPYLGAVVVVVIALAGVGIWRQRRTKPTPLPSETPPNGPP